MKKLFLILGALMLFSAGGALAQDTTSHDAMDMAHDGPLVVHNAWIRATVARAPVAGGFAVIENRGEADDWLVGGSSVIAGEVQVHEMSVTDGVMKMRPLADGLRVPAGESVVLKPGSFHLMFMKLAQQMLAGDSAVVTLNFANAGEMMVTFAVLAMGETLGETLGETMDHSADGMNMDTKSE